MTAAKKAAKPVEDAASTEVANELPSEKIEGVLVTSDIAGTGEAVNADTGEVTAGGEPLPANALDSSDPAVIELDPASLESEFEEMPAEEFEILADAALAAPQVAVDSPVVQPFRGPSYADLNPTG